MASFQQVFDKAEACKGIHSWDVSQSHTMLHQQLARGICFAASCYYISKHKSGESFREFLGMYQQSKRVFIPINHRAVTLLKAEQRQFASFNAPVFNVWLNHKSGLKKRRETTGSVETMSMLRSMLPVNSGYMLFGFTPPAGSGHAVAAYFGNDRNGRTPVRFFDINFGEFLFRDRYEFFVFFEWLMRQAYQNDRTSQYRFFHLV